MSVEIVEPSCQEEGSPQWNSLVENDHGNISSRSFRNILYSLFVDAVRYRLALISHLRRCRAAFESAADRQTSFDVSILAGMVLSSLRSGNMGSRADPVASFVTAFLRRTCPQKVPTKHTILGYVPFLSVRCSSTSSSRSSSEERWTHTRVFCCF